MTIAEALILEAGTKKESSDSLINQSQIGVFAENVFYTSMDGNCYRLSDILRQFETALTQSGHILRDSIMSAYGPAKAQVADGLQNEYVGMVLATGTDDEQTSDW